MQRYFVKEKKDNYLFLEDTDVHHLKNVMRYCPGDIVECVYDGILYEAKIVDTLLGKVEITKTIDSVSHEDFDVTIAVSLVKEQKMDFILQKLTELGVSRIIPLKMERSIVKLDEKRWQSKRERWMKICKEAAEQSKRTTIPEILDMISVRELKNYSFDDKFVCDTGDDVLLINDYVPKLEKKRSIIFVIGAEGGITDKELEILKSSGFVPISLGRRVMRVETAAIFLASIMSYSSMG